MTVPVTYYTTSTGPGQAVEQTIPSLSLGGYASLTAWGGGVRADLFGRASSADVRDARADYRCIYFYNPDSATTLTDVRLYVIPRTTGAVATAVGVDPRPASYVDALASQSVEISSAYNTPAGVTFGTPGTYGAGLSVGDLPPLAGRSFWIKRVPAGEAGAANDAADVVLEDAVGGVTVRRVYWETEPYADSTYYSPPQVYTETPSPFRRVDVDFLTAGGSRVTWNLDPSMTDVGPYVFQLQAAQSGVAAETDWADVGPPAQDPLYLLDAEQRIWGMTATLHYRIVLTTATGTYTSPPANVFGRLNQEQWVQARELVRKEQLMQRRFVGLDGFLLKAKRYGTRCSCTDSSTNEILNSRCPLCYGTGVTGGYHVPVPLTFSTLTNQSSKERVSYNENLGTTKPVVLRGRVIANLPVVARDVWVQIGSDERYYAHGIEVLVAKGSVPVVYGVEWRLAPRSDILYAFPLERPVNPQPDWKTPTAISL